MSGLTFALFVIGITLLAYAFAKLVNWFLDGDK